MFDFRLCCARERARKAESAERDSLVFDRFGSRERSESTLAAKKICRAVDRTHEACGVYRAHCVQMIFHIAALSRTRFRIVQKRSKRMGLRETKKSVRDRIAARALLRSAKRVAHRCARESVLNQA